jgi:hypothetical protein
MTLLIKSVRRHIKKNRVSSNQLRFSENVDLTLLFRRYGSYLLRYHGGEDRARNSMFIALIGHAC